MFIVLRIKLRIFVYTFHFLNGRMNPRIIYKFMKLLGSYKYYKYKIDNLDSKIFKVIQDSFPKK